MNINCVTNKIIIIIINKLTRGGKTSNLAKHLSLAHPDLFRELTLEIDRLVSAL